MKQKIAVDSKLYMLSRTLTTVHCEVTVGLITNNASSQIVKIVKFQDKYKGQ